MAVGGLGGMQTLVLRDANDLMVMIRGSLNCRVFPGSNVRADVSVSRIAMGFFPNVAETVLVRAYKRSIGCQSLLVGELKKVALLCHLCDVTVS